MGRQSPVALAIVLGTVVIGCAVPAASPSGTAAPDSAAPSVAEPVPSPTVAPGAEILRLGESTRTPRESLMTVYSFGLSDRTTAPPAGTAWYAADIEFCMAPAIESAVSVANLRYEFAVELESKLPLRADSAFGGPNEIYSEPGRTIVADECVRGPVVFAVPDDDPARYVGLFVGIGERRWVVGNGG